ncbi:MAG: glycosyltransferase family 4 protein [Planctomycetes bacterium]|nr:glycosyltransferase family 4 protein [Planctomycetota bacterium]MCH9726380.1 glycosyltransferase family 4 protein [Planctomycetota bacterium]MCH9775880.1 glycosyltransferase family 4 protein [Planctomycetota bacterium]MCH9791287.1 glycosyltransferase family 4 protein [Planctomycetota bacterium]
MRVAHVITRMIIGGAQQNTLFTVEDQYRDYQDEVSLMTGPTTGPEGTLIPRAEQGGMDLRIIPHLTRSISPLNEWRACRELIAELRDFQPELVHTHSSKAGILGRAAAWKLKIPTVHTIHGAAFHFGQSPLHYRAYIAAEKWAARRCDRLISVCDAMTHQYVAAGITTKDRCDTVYSGMEVEPFLTPSRLPVEVRKEWGIEPHHIVIGKVARLFHLKGHKYLIEAARRVVEAEPQVRFLLVGDGILKAEFEERIAELGLSEHFIFTGLVPPERVPELIHAMDIVVHTSVWEGLARVLPQGLIAGKPVVSYDIDGAREVVIPEETGYLLPSESIEPLSQALIELASDPEKRERFGQTGRARFTDQFRHETMTRQIREIYQRVLDDRKQNKR